MAGILENSNSNVSEGNVAHRVFWGVVSIVCFTLIRISQIFNTMQKVEINSIVA